MSGKEIRKELIKGIIEEMRGPRHGIDEVVEYNPGTEYLVSTMIPKSWEPPKKDKKVFNDLDEDNVNESDYKNTDDSNLNDDTILGGSSPILNPNSQMRSFGFSFMVNSQKSIDLDICVTWARYFEDEKSEFAYGLNGEEVKRDEKKIFWKRESYGGVYNFKIDASFKGEVFPVYESDEGEINLFIKRQDMAEDKSHISIYLVNDLNLSSSRKKYRPAVQDCVFQPSIRVNLLNSEKPVGMDTVVGSNKEMDFLYLSKPVLATGHLCSVVWKDIEYYQDFEDFKNLIWPDESKIENYLDFIEPSIRSEFLPLYPINLPNFKLPNVNPEIKNLEFRANKLAYMSQNELYENLMILYDSYKIWIDENVSKSKDCPDEYVEIIDNILDKEYEMLDRIKEGIDLIKCEELAYYAFCFANKTIHLQDEWKRNINTTKNTNIGSGCDDKAFKWRPFQLAFILISLESICNKKSENKNILDLLWIPTGGGKTEAYLGIMAFTMALRRLKAKDGILDEKTGAGVSIISRYTLRLLTVQQFRRTLRMVTAAEYLRVYKSNGYIGWRNSYGLEGDWIYGSVRFSVGMWVGGSVTPLHLNKEDDGAIDILKAGDENKGYGNPAQIMRCPVCGAWIAIPEEGLRDTENHVHLVIDKNNNNRDKIEERFKFIEDEEYVESIKVKEDNMDERYATVSILFNRPINKEEYSKIVSFIYDNYEMVSLNKFIPGYIKSQGRLGSTRIRHETDYEIWCTNPDCCLNHEWKEGVPTPDNEFEFPDGNFLRDIENPFKNNSRIPIPAYLIDEHVYYRCPTVIISTADKIARLAFEPRASSLFGIVNKYHEYYGYYRNELLPKHAPSTQGIEKEIQALSPPDLIIQDELHLLNGPLGSLFGLYENVVDALIKKQKGNPKYIASTATINNAEKQVNLLFSKEVKQFPPYGLDISSSFFVNEADNQDNDEKIDLWNENNQGRVYLGLYASGFGHFTHQIRIYSRLLKIANNNFKEKNGIYYWTIVGYYNAIKELGSGVALYKDDILSRLKNISTKDEVRDLKPESDNIELSSRIDSTKLPLILDKLERDGKKETPEFSAIFTTSMFGTGVDISHLSTMIMNAQPKTTGDYIQATGRIGRNHGGLIIDLFRSGRPRDLNHYELFPSYHSRINREVEPISVSPFSEGCLSRGLGSSLVSFLRNIGNLEFNLDDEPMKILDGESDKYISIFKKNTEKRLNNIGLNNDASRILTKIDKCVGCWRNVAEEMDGEKNNLVYYEPFNKRNPGISKHVVLGDSAHEKSDKEVVYNNAPMSLRDIEDTLEFWV